MRGLVGVRAGSGEVIITTDQQIMNAQWIISVKKSRAGLRKPSSPAATSTALVSATNNMNDISRI